MKGGFERMMPQKHSSFSTHFQQIFAAFCVLLTEKCILLFFLNLASKFRQSLIMNTKSKIKKLNRIQTNFDSNVHIATFDHEPSAPKNKLSQTEACCHFAPPTFRFPLRSLRLRRAVTSRRRYKPNPKGIFV
jgi:hypothetical protein